ncbi:MAG: protein kinase domain-containing protein [Verrucomicrobiales bacterium]
MKLPQLTGYHYEELLGEGPCGWVFRCTYNGEERAVKVLKSQATNRALIGSCLRAIKGGKVKHPAIPPIYQMDLDGRPLAFAMPLYGRRDTSTGKWNSMSLENYCGTLPADRCIGLIDQLADALACLHRNGVFHVGLKPSNLFITTDDENRFQIKISDFGQGYIAGVQYLEMGDAGFYCSAEQLETGDLSGGQGTLWDVYSFGVVAYRLFTGHLPRLDSRFAQYQQNPEAIGCMPALAHGELFEGAETFINWLKLEPQIKWPTQPQSEREASRRFVIEKCLALDPNDRFSDMREVREALLQSEHQLQINQLTLEKNATSQPKKVVKGSGLWKAAAMFAGVAFFAALIGCGILFGMYKSAENRKTTALTKVAMTAEQAQAAAMQAMDERKNFEEAMKLKLAEAKVSNEEVLNEASTARGLLREVQANGDRFFELIMENRDSDVPGFELKRASALSDGRKYYERLIAIYDGAPEFALSIADANRYLSEIYTELGDFQRAKASLTESAQHYNTLLQADQKNVGVIRGMARVKQLQATVLEKVGTTDGTLAAIDDSNRFLQALSAADPTAEFEASVEIADNLYGSAETFHRMAQYERALEFARASGDRFVELQASHPNDDQVLAGIARSFGITGDLLAVKGRTKECEAAYQQSADMYAQAINLNGAVDDYQLGLGKAMGQIGLISKDTAKLQAASKVLAEVVPANPFKSKYQKTLAEVFGVLADQQRDGGQKDKAMELSSKAVSILKPIIEAGNGVPADVQFIYAERLVGLAKLQGDSADFSEAIALLKQAIEILNQLVKTDLTNPTYRRSLAHAQGQAGFACAKADDETSAKQHYQFAQSDWVNYVAQFPNDAVAKAEAKWVKEQLDRL